MLDAVRKGQAVNNMPAVPFRGLLSRVKPAPLITIRGIMHVISVHDGMHVSLNNSISSCWNNLWPANNRNLFFMST